MKKAFLIIFSMLLIMIFCSCNCNVPLPGWRANLTTATVIAANPTTAPVAFRQISYESELVATSNWKSYNKIGEKASVIFDLPVDWSFENGVAYDKNGSRQMKLYKLIRLYDKQVLLDTYGIKSNRKSANDVARKIVTTDNYSAKLVVTEQKSGDKKSYLFNYYFYSGVTAVCLSFSADSINADTQVFEHIVDSTVIIENLMPSTVITTSTIAASTSTSNDTALK